MMQKHFVTFLCAGGFFPEDFSYEVSEWSIEVAKEHMDTPSFRGNPPYCFYFTTSRREDDEFTPKQVARSKKYYINGKVYQLDEIPVEMEILRSNISQYNPPMAIKCRSGNWQPFETGDQVIYVS